MVNTTSCHIIGLQRVIWTLITLVKSKDQVYATASLCKSSVNPRFIEELMQHLLEEPVFFTLYFRWFLYRPHPDKEEILAKVDDPQILGGRSSKESCTLALQVIVVPSLLLHLAHGLFSYLEEILLIES